MLTTNTLILTDTARLVTAAIAGLFGLTLLYAVAFAGPDVLHNAAHDMRHAIVAPCHKVFAMMIRVLLAALVAGVLAGGFATAAQQVRVVPLILEAETYEKAGAAHDHSEGTAAGQSGAAVADEPGEAWAPAEGIERMLYTLAANVAAGVAFSLILTAGILFARTSIGAPVGIVWGACGFIAFVLAPNFGLPPELPGMAAAELSGRQAWWAATVTLTSAGLWIFAFKRGAAWMALGVGLVLAMHVVGAPRPEAHETAVPANLAAEFAVATIVTSAAFWVVLGGLLGYALNRAMSVRPVG